MHTPGPWEFVPEEGNGLHTIWTGQTGVYGILIARTCFAPNSENNARLIASAPDLPEALENIVNRHYCVDAYEPDHPAVLALNKAHEAIRKARGE